MATNLDIIKRAMKKLHVLTSGTEPSAAQAFDGMALLQSLIIELIGQGSLGRLNDVLATSDYTAFENDRVHASTGVVVTLPTTITTERCTDPVPFELESTNTISARPPRDRAPIVVIDSMGVATFSVWNTHAGAWVTINDLTEQGAFPFAQYLEDGFAALLAERWVDDWDQTLGNETKRTAGLCRFMLSTQYDSQSRPAVACFF